MPQFPRDLLVSLPEPKPRVTDNLVTRALSQTVGSDDLLPQSWSRMPFTTFGALFSVFKAVQGCT